MDAQSPGRGATTRGFPISDLIGLVTQGLGGGGIASLAGLLGSDEQKTTSGLSSVLSVLTGALARNSEDEQGAAALDAALEKDHDGGILDNIGGFLGNIGGGSGAGILGHVLGDKQEPVAKEIAKDSGLDLGQVMTLMTAAAPLLMGVLGKKKKEEGLDAGGVAGMLAQEKQQVEQSGGFDLGSVLGLLTGGGGGGSSSSSGGGMLSKLGGLLSIFKKSK
ncbi:MAG: DUF937 domain-containing protein [Actinobacteria bacterium]|nr:DUF937 domain-containing protein [Actinomycetota bacterium]